MQTQNGLKGATTQTDSARTPARWFKESSRGVVGLPTPREPEEHAENTWSNDEDQAK